MSYGMQRRILAVAAVVSLLAAAAIWFWRPELEVGAGVFQPNGRGAAGRLAGLRRRPAASRLAVAVAARAADRGGALAAFAVAADTGDRSRGDLAKSSVAWVKLSVFAFLRPDKQELAPCTGCVSGSSSVSSPPTGNNTSLTQPKRRIPSVTPRTPDIPITSVDRRIGEMRGNRGFAHKILCYLHLFWGDQDVRTYFSTASLWRGYRGRLRCSSCRVGPRGSSAASTMICLLGAGPCRAHAADNAEPVGFGRRNGDAPDLAARVAALEDALKKEQDKAKADKAKAESAPSVKP